MLEYINTIAGVTGALAGLIAAIISVLTYFETRKSRKYGEIHIDNRKESDQVDIDSNELAVATTQLDNDVFEQEIILFDKYHDRTTVFLGLVIWSIGGITYSNTSELVASIIAGFGFGIASYIVFILPFLAYWKRRIKSRIYLIDIAKAQKFVEQYAWKESDSKEVIEDIISKY